MFLGPPFHVRTALRFLMFGADVRGYHRLDVALLTLFRVCLGDFDISSLQVCLLLLVRAVLRLVAQYSRRIVGPLFFIGYIVLGSFIVLSMFISIVNDAYR